MECERDILRLINFALPLSVCLIFALPVREQSMLFKLKGCLKNNFLMNLNLELQKSAFDFFYEWCFLRFCFSSILNVNLKIICNPLWPCFKIKVLDSDVFLSVIVCHGTWSLCSRMLFPQWLGKSCTLNKLNCISKQQS